MHINSLKTIVVDDEQPSRDALIQIIRDFCPELEVVADCNSAKTAYTAIREHHPDLVFLDIEMPKGSGFDLLKMCNPVDFKVIFVTAFSTYAVQSYRYSAVDYLLKPIKVGELIEAVAKVRNGNMSSSLPIQVLLENFRTTDEKLKKLVISNSKGFTVIRPTDIILCVADGYCTNFHLQDNFKITSSKLLKYYEEILPKEKFMRVHHSYIINIEHVKGYTNQGLILLSEDYTCPLSTLHKTSFMKRLKTMV